MNDTHESVMTFMKSYIHFVSSISTDRTLELSSYTITWHHLTKCFTPNFEGTRITFTCMSASSHSTQRYWPWLVFSGLLVQFLLNETANFFWNRGCSLRHMVPTSATDYYLCHGDTGVQSQLANGQHHTNRNVPNWNIPIWNFQKIGQKFKKREIFIFLFILLCAKSII